MLETDQNRQYELGLATGVGGLSAKIRTLRSLLAIPIFYICWSEIYAYDLLTFMYDQRIDRVSTNLTMTRTAVQTYVTEEREEEMKQAVEEGGWNTLADYIRHMIRAGESDFADLDPRTNGGSEGENRRVTDAELRSQLNDEYQDFDEVVEDLIADFEADLSHRLFEMATDDGTGIETDGKGNYRLEQ